MLNENQQRHLWVSCQHIDKLLSEVEHILNVSTSKATFPIYYLDIAPAQRRIIEDYIARIRAQLVRVLESQRIPTPRPSIPVRRAILATVAFVDIAVEELLPRYMRGYGALPQDVAIELNGIVGELDGMVSRLTRYISQSEGEDLKAHLRRLEQTSDELHLLSEVERVVTERGLVEYRLTIASILDRLEDKSFEIAIFGRVSSGKSSLLNAVLETSVLPVGVTPITAVPTRIVYGESPSLTIRFSERQAQTCGVERLAEFATEQQNPGNSKHVTGIVLRLPSSRLRAGVAFVDTPGLGALATSGAAETLAYLPRCDLGVVLIDAGSTLTPDDLRTIQTLLDAAVPVNLLLSKADLLSPDDRDRVVAYVREHVATECRLELPAHPVSSLAAHPQMLQEWFEQEILPLYERAQELKAASIRRKVGALRESVVSALRVRLRQKQSTAGRKSEVREIESRLRRVTGKLEELRGTSLREVETLAFQGGSQAFDSAAAALLEWWESRKVSSDSAGTRALELLRDFGQEKTNSYSQQIESLAKELVRELKQAAIVLELSHAPDEDEFSSVVRGMPTLELPSVNLRLTKPVLAKWLGGIARGQVARELREQTGAAYEQAIENYYGMLRQWLLATFGQLRKRFDAYAESYRAQAQQTLGGGALTAEEARKIKQDLEALGAAEAGSKPLISGEADVPADK
jgi:GTP-binding protein EngB required for normal cell division